MFAQRKLRQSPEEGNEWHLFLQRIKRVGIIGRPGEAPNPRMMLGESAADTPRDWVG